MSSTQQLILGEGAGGAPTGYQIERSLRFNSADSASLSRTPASASNRKTWTWSGWVKRSALSAGHCLFSAANGTSEFQQIKFDDTNNTIDYILYTPSGIVGRLITTQVFRDVSSWYHIVAVWDTANATAGNRMRLYVNGSEINDFSTDTQPTLDLLGYVNNTVDHRIGETSAYGSNYFAGYLTEINFIDGQALTPSSFGQTNSATGVWEPIAYTGTYGTNGFYLNFSDNSNNTSTTLGKDSSGNGNNWTPNNFSVTAGVNNDSMVDTPTPYGTDTGAGGEVRGNYATINPVDLSSSNPLPIANGALQMTAPGVSTYYNGRGTMVPTAKVYVEITLTGSSTNYFSFGLQDINSAVLGNNYTGASSSNSIGFGDLGFSNYYIYNNGSGTDSGLTMSATDVIQIAYDPDTKKVWFGRNNTWYNSGNPAAGTNATATLTSTITYNFAFTNRGSVAAYVNFGQRAWTYTAPSGFKALCTQNLPTPTIGATSTTQAGKYFNPVLYNGNSSGASVTGVGFQPDFVWMKCRSTSRNHELLDAVRGGSSTLFSNLTNAQATDQRISSFNSDGFTYTTNSNSANTGDTFVAWNWKANGAGSTNTAGSIQSTVSANTTAGFSIVTYTGNATSGASVGHGLNATPAFVIIKDRGAVSDWRVWTTSFGTGRGLSLNSTTATSGNSEIMQATPTSTLMYLLGSGYGVNNSSNTYVAYCFAPVASYSSFGSYTGNGSSDGTFIYTGFRAKYVIVKSSSVDGTSWIIFDAVRNPYNAADAFLSADLSNAETAAYPVDFLSNGFKIRTTTSNLNTSGGTYVYACFAENPFKYSLAR